MEDKEKKTTKVEQKIKKSVPKSDVVDVKNVSKMIINTSKGQIKPGEKGICTRSESRSLGKFLELE